MNPTIAIVARGDEARLSMVKALDRAPLHWVLELHREAPSRADVIVCEPGADIPEAIVFDPHDRDLVATIAGRLAPSTRTVLVTSPSGGIGVTSVSIHLAAEYAYLGHATALVDLTSDQGVRGRLGLDRVEDAEAPVPVAGGFRLIPGLDAGRAFERVVVDAPRDAVSTAGRVAAGVLVCPPSPEGARRARRMLEVHPGVPWTVIVNRLGPGGETTRVSFERLLGREVLELSCCAALRDAEDEARLLPRGWTRWSRAIARLAARLDAI